MCGRFAQGFAIRVMAEQLERGEMGIDDIRDLDNHYPSYNVAPTTYQAVYRRERSDNQDHTSDAVSTSDHVTPDAPSHQSHVSGSHEQNGSAQQTPVEAHSQQNGSSGSHQSNPRSANDTSATSSRTRHILQGMKWGLIPFWTKRAPDSGSQLKTINCRDDSLYENRGMWNSMKGRKRCIVPVQGYYEWHKKSPKEKIPHFTKRKDGQLLMLAGLYDCVQYEGSDERIWTFTIITTAANKNLSWLHDRMPLILDPGTDEMRRWLDDDAWSQDLVTMLKPYEGDLDCYAVKKEVGKVGNNSPDFIIPIDSKENKSNIANFFQKKEAVNSPEAQVKAEGVVKDEKTDTSMAVQDNDQSENNAPMPDTTSVKDEQPEEKSVLGEDDLPFRFIPSHLESRQLETIDVFTAQIQPAETRKLIDFINNVLKPDIRETSHLKRVKGTGPGRPRGVKRIKLEEGAEPQKPTQIDVLLCSCIFTSEADLEKLMQENGFDVPVKTTAVPKYPALTIKQLSEWRELWPLAWQVPQQRRFELAATEYEECERIMDSMLDSAALMATSPDMPITAVAWNPITKSEVARASDARNTSGHPLKHALMELVAAVAAYEVMRRIDDPDGEAQYLCSNLYIFVTHEPCTMCCMALLHSRVAKVFYAQKMDETGGLESNYGIHWRTELNHRFVVFGGWKAERAVYIDDKTDDDEIDEIETVTWQQKSIEDELGELEEELYTFHPPRSFPADEPDVKFQNPKNEEDTDNKSPSVERTLPQARSQPRRARPRLQKKVPKMTDFFGRKAS